MDQPELFHESVSEALRATVAAIGGAKVVASALWPEKSLDDANRRLLDCLNPDRAARLDPEELILLLKLARAKGVHLAMTWISNEVGYADPQPVEPVDEYAELQRQFNSKVDQLEALAKRMGRVSMKAVG